MEEQKPPTPARGMGGSSFTETLQELKRGGCNVLVCGAVPRTDIEYLSSRLLGEATKSSDVTRLFGLLDQDVMSIHRRLALNNDTLDSTRVITTDGGVRSASAVDVSALTDQHHFEVTTVPHGLRDLEAELHREIEEIGRERDRNDRTNLRVCIDSLQPLFAEYQTERVEAFLFDLDEAAGVNQCMVHSILPVAYDAPIVKWITPHFDIVMSLRVAEGNAVEQRWRLVASDRWTDWLPLRLDPTESLSL